MGLSTSLWFSLSAYATVLGAILIRSSGILAPSFYNILFRNFHFDIRDAHSIHPRAYIATAFSPHGSGIPLRGSAAEIAPGSTGEGVREAGRYAHHPN